MKLFVLMAQRKEAYPGEYGPEALTCMDEYQESGNPEWLPDKQREAEASGEFESVVILQLEVNSAEIMRLLRPSSVRVHARVIPF